MTDPDHGWAVVLFEGEDESVEAVPYNWLDAVFDASGEKVGFCYWPPKTTKNITELAKKKDPFVEGVWKSYPVKVLGENYDSYELARYKSIKAIERSDLESSDVNLSEKKRKTIPREIFSPASKPKKYRRKNLSESDSSIEENLPPALPALPSRPTPITTQPTLIGAKTITPKKTHQAACFSSPQKKRSLSIPYSEFLAFKRETARTLTDISMQLAVLSENVCLALKNKTDVCVNSDDVIDEEFNNILSLLPFKTYEEVLNAEKSLALKTVFEALFNHLSRIGGITPKEATKRMIKTLLTDEAAQYFSFYGLKQKSAFTKLKMKDALFKSVKMNFKNCTDSEIEVVVKDWLRQAKCRIENRNKTSKAAENETA